MNPACTDAEMKRDTKPAFSTPRATRTRPTRMARAADSSPKRAVSPMAGRDQRRRDGRRGRGGADHQLPRAAEQGVAEQPGEGGEQPGLRRQLGDLGVGDRLGHDQCPGGQGGHHVAAQPGPLVVAEPVQGGQQPGGERLAPALRPAG
jgi:hypothetical protein